MSMRESGSVTMEQIVSLCKRRGFVYPSADIYGGFANAWDYGPLGVEMRRKPSLDISRGINKSTTAYRATRLLHRHGA